MNLQQKVKEISRDICKGNTICTCFEKDGHCISVQVIAKRLAEQGYTKREHGKWLITDRLDAHKQPVFICSVCYKEVADWYIDQHKFCLHCGSEMEEPEKRRR